YYGSDAHGFFRDIDIDDQGFVYGILNAVRRSAPGIKPDAFDTRHNGGQFDMAAVKFTPTLDSVIWATMLGGSGKDRGGPSIRVGTDYSVFVAGGTESMDFPVTPGSVQTQFGGGRTDMFVARIKPDGTDLIYCTYFGGNDFDVTETHGLWVDDHNQAHVACGTKSTDIQTTPGAIKATKPGDDLDALLFKLSSDGAELMASSYYGGSGDDYAEGLFTSADGDLYFGGTMGSNDLPVTNGAFQNTYAGGEDAFIARVDSNFTQLKYSSYFGGSEMDAVRAFAEGPGGSIVFGGQTQSNDMPTTPGAFQEQRMVNNDRADCFVAVLTPDQMSAATDLEIRFHKAPWPNPTDQYLNFDASSQKGQLQIHLPTGGIMYRGKIGHSKKTIDLSNYPQGIYFYNIHYENGQQITGKFMRQ
ncbi:MAG TPA: T9SS type A sorting domain-containing protein, partial [Saprospiraceae bacterium]|nr:T9SS type A sorting domain-containing protein [Saprospiraceae bacterium]